MLLAVMARRRTADPFRPLIPTVAVVAIALLAARIANAAWLGRYSTHYHFFNTHLRLDSLLFGVAISYAYHFHAERFRALLYPRRRALIALGLALLSPPFIFPLTTTPFIYTAGLTLFYVGSGALLVGTLLSSIPRHPLVSGVAAAGAYSYSIYLWHFPVRDWGATAVERILRIDLSYTGETLIYLVGSLLVGVSMAWLIEMPMLRLRDKWYPARVEAATKPAPLARAA
jgi:peptidoglycan/LPS O-acetylase OafA/YrhL